MRRFVIRLCLIFSLLMGSIAQAQIKVACVGNSITEGGWGLKDNEAYPVVLQGLLANNYVVNNYGNSGCTILKNGDRPYWNQGDYDDAKRWQPDIVIIKFGTNDSKTWNWRFKDEFYSDYVEFINSFKALNSKPKIYICIPLPVLDERVDPSWGISENVLRKEVIPLVKKAAQNTQCEIINLYAAFYGKLNNLISSDGVHPTAAGAALIAQEVFKAITK